jgi:hypothetical protein
VFRLFVCAYVLSQIENVLTRRLSFREELSCDERTDCKKMSFLQEN